MARYSERLSPLTVSVPVVTEWVSYTATATNFTFATQDFRWRRVGNTIEVAGRFSTTGAGVAATAALSIPSGLTMDTTQWPAAVHVGRWANSSNTNGHYKTGSIFVQPSNSTTVNFATADIADTTSAFSLLAGSHISPAALTLHVHFTVPISGWTSHSPSAATANAIVNGGNSFGGALTIGTNDNFGVNIETNGTDSLLLSAAGALTAGKTTTPSPHIFRNSTNASLVVRATDTTTAALTFQLNNGDYYGDIYADQSTSARFTARVRDAGGGALTFLQATNAGAVTVGPISAIGGTGFAGASIVGRTNGAAVSAGYVGESVEGTQLSLTSFPATGTYGDGTSVTLTAGRWVLTAVIDAEQNTATGTAIIGAIGSAPGNSLAGATAGDTLLSTSFPTANNNTSVCIASSIKNITASTTYYLKVGATFSAGTPRYRCRLTAIRIA